MKAAYPLYQRAFDVVSDAKGTEFSLIVYIDATPNFRGAKRLRIPLPAGLVETLTEIGWETDNLDYVEFLAKQKGLV